MRSRLIFGALAATALLAMIAYFQSGRNGTAQAAEFANELDLAQYLNAAIDREILLLESGRRMDFDRLAGYAAALRRDESAMAVARTFDGSALDQSVLRKIALVEDFKTRLAVYRNSARSGVVLAGEIVGADGDRLTSTEYTALVPAIGEFLTVLAFGDAPMDTLRKALEGPTEVGIRPGVWERWTAFRNHARLVVDNRDDLRDMVRDITNPAVPDAINALRVAVETWRVEQAWAATLWRTLLLLSALVFAGLLHLAIRANVARTVELQRLNGDLERRVAERTGEIEAAAHHLRQALDEVHTQQVSLRRLSVAVQNAAEGVAILSSDLTIQFANRAFAQMFGCDSEILTGARHPDAEHLAQDPHLAGTGSTGDGVGYELVLHKASGEEITVEQSVSQMESDDGTTVEYVVVCRDVTRRKRLETNLLNAQKLESIGQLSAGIAHEINTPTQYVSDNVQFFQDVWEDLSPLLEQLRASAQTDDAAAETWKRIDGEYLLEEVPPALRHAREGLTQIKTIVQAMKNFAHPGVNAKEPTDINAAIQDTATIARNEWKYVADLELDLDPSVPDVAAVRSALNQVWLNMIVNAAHAIESAVGRSGERGTILISTRAVQDAVEIRITDTGCGIPEEIRGRIFDPFFTTKGVGRGSGQGLAIAYGIITEQHNGRVEVRSQVGRGTTFVITLPVGQQAAAA